MLEFIRTHRRLMQFLLLLIIFPSFAFFGLESYTRMSGKEAPVAKVAGKEISQREWDAAHARQLDRFKQMFGEQFNPAMFDTPDARQGTLENLVAQRALSGYVMDNHLTVSDDTLRKTIVDIGGLKNADGSFDKERYKQLLAAQGLTAEKFEASLRHDLAIQQLNAVIQGTAFVPKAVAQRISSLNQQKREVQELNLNVADFKSQVKVTDAMLQTYYDEHAAQFEVPEMVKAEYVVLAAPVVEAQVSVTEADIKQYYEQNLARYKTDEQRRASHILINAAKDAPAAERQAARSKAQELLAQLRKAPKSFADVARKNSQDPGSASKGGDLDFFARGAMVKPFEDAVFGMKEGEISDVVESEFGFHIIELTAIKAPKAPSFEAMRPQLEADLRKQQAQRKFAEMAETFSNGVYEQSDALQPVADKLKLSLKRAQGVTRVPSASVPNELSNPKLLQALFSDDAVSKRRNTEAVETGTNTLVSARIVKHHPSVVRPLAEVKDEVRRQFVQTRALELARQEGQTQLSAWQKQPEGASLGKPVLLSRDQPSGQQQALVEAALRADPAKLPAWVGVDLGNEGYAVLRVNKIVPREAQSPEQAQQARQQFAQLWSQTEVQAYLAALRKALKVDIVASAKSASPSEKP